MTPTRRALLAAGVATIAVSMGLSIAPVIAANGNNGNNGNSGNGGGNAGSIKVYDATTGQETADGDNDPHVCGFWVAFYAPAPYESGTWQLLSWAPTGDGSLVSSGTYYTNGDGLDATATLDPGPGHYRFEWTSVGSNTSKHKTLWVDACGTDEVPPADEETPLLEEETTPTDEETPPAEDETSPSQNNVPPSEDETSPSQDQPGESAILAGNPSTPVVENPAPEAAVATGPVATTLPDTSIPIGSSGVLGALGLLLVVAAHAGRRRRTLRG